MPTGAEEQSLNWRKLSIGGILVEVGAITEAQLQEAVKECTPDQKNLGEVLVAKGFLTEEHFLKTVSLRLGITYFTTFEGMLDPMVADLVPEAMARKYLSVPVMKTDEALTVGMVNPLDIYAIDELQAHTGLKIMPVLTTLSNLFDTVNKLYLDRQVAEQPAWEGDLDQTRPAKKTGAAAHIEQTAIDIVNSLLEEAISRKASDLHIESAKELVRVRYRIDGVLHDAQTFPKDIEATLTARVKILARLDITETRAPQDGRFQYEYGGIGYDVRVSTLPSVHGEKLALRVLDPAGLKNLKDIGFFEKDLQTYRAVIRQPNGIILVTGPTGSGKTTTLYSTLGELNAPERHIVTLEDPVEYRIDRINQVEVNPKVGMGFAAGLRAILRQDPNVILVGEIRDLETAEIAIQAAITGHMVFSTLHTNDAISVVPRLINMKVEPFLLGASLRLVLAQRLLRKLCDKCKQPRAPTDFDVAVIGHALEGNFFGPVGCEDCFNTGYSGRLAIYELFVLTPAIRELILKRPSVDDLRVAARAEGMRSLHDDAVDKASQGVTSIEEVIRATHAEE